MTITRRLSSPGTHIEAKAGRKNTIDTVAYPRKVWLAFENSICNFDEISSSTYNNLNIFVMLTTKTFVDEVWGKAHDNDCTRPLQDSVNKKHQNSELAWAHFMKSSLSIK